MENANRMPKIMIVEDERIVAMDIKKSLESLGYTVSAIASSGEAALKKVVETQPDLVLMDINLKGNMDGVQTAEQIRFHFSIPIIYLTAYADHNTLQRAKLTEPFGYILKPFEDTELRVSIEMALYKHQRERQVKASAHWFATTLKSIGDAVIATNKNNSLVFINTLAEALTGWKQEDALAKDLTDVFNIVTTRLSDTTVIPVINATHEGVVSLPEDTTLLAKAGTAILITGSAAAIRDSKGNIIGTILIFRAIDKPKQAHSLPQTSVGEKILTVSDDMALIQTLIQNFVQGQAILLANANLRAEPVGDTIQLIAKTEGVILKATLTDNPRTALVNRSSRYWELIHQAMFANSFFSSVSTQTQGFYRYKHRPIPKNYQMHCTSTLELWHVWSEHTNNPDPRPRAPMEIIMLKDGIWLPIKDVICGYGKNFYIKTVGDKVTIDGADMLIWGKK